MQPKISDECLLAHLNEGFKQAEIAKSCDISRQAVNMRVHGSPTSKQSLKGSKLLRLLPQIIEMLNAGVEQKDIAEHFKCTQGALSRALKKYCIKRWKTNESALKARMTLKRKKGLYETRRNKI